MRLRPSPHTVATLSLGPLLGGLLAGLLAGCEPPPGLDETPPPPPSYPTDALTAPPTGPPPVLPTGAATGSPGFGDDRAVGCGGRPSPDDMLAVLYTEGVLADDLGATVTDGPVCAGTWQYAVISVPDLDPLQMVTRGEPDALELVTAGTDVCTVDVRVHAPPGIRTAAACVG